MIRCTLKLNHAGTQGGKAFAAYVFTDEWISKVPEHLREQASRKVRFICESCYRQGMLSRESTVGQYRRLSDEEFQIALTMES